MELTLNYQVSSNLKGILQDFTLCVLLKKPENLYDFAIDYFTSLKVQKIKPKIYKNVEDDTIISDIALNKRRMTVCDISYRPDEIDENEFRIHKITYHKEPRQIEFLHGLLSKLWLFRNIEPDSLDEIIETIQERKVQKGELIIREGSDGDFFYIVNSGEFHVYKIDENNHKYIIKVCKEGDYFGELAIMYNTPRTASVVARSDGELWAMRRDLFKKILSRNTYVSTMFYANSFNKNKILSLLSLEEQLKLIDALKVLTYQKFDRIINEGEIGNGFYIILLGSVVVTIRNPMGKSVELKKLHAGSYFGERALITHERRKTSVIAVEEVRLGFIETEAFERLLGPCISMMQRSAKDYEKQIRNILNKSKPEL